MPKRELYSDIFGPASTVTIPRTDDVFVAKEKFVRDITDAAAVKISYLGDRFTDWFLSGEGKVESGTGERTLCRYDMRGSLEDRVVVAECGGKEGAETFLSELFALMQRQGKGEGGVLGKEKGCLNAFYVRDAAGTLRVVCVFWYELGWGIEAMSIPNPFWRNRGEKVFVRDSAPASRKP